MVTDEQVKLLRPKRMEGKTQASAAAIAGMSERTARRWGTGPLPSMLKAQRPRDWRTRKDPFEGVWEQDVVPLLLADERGQLQVNTLFEMLEEKQPGRFRPGQRRALERIVAAPAVLIVAERQMAFRDVVAELEASMQARLLGVPEDELSFLITPRKVVEILRRVPGRTHFHTSRR